MRVMTLRGLVWSLRLQMHNVRPLISRAFLAKVISVVVLKLVLVLVLVVLLCLLGREARHLRCMCRMMTMLLVMLRLRLLRRVKCSLTAATVVEL